MAAHISYWRKNVVDKLQNKLPLLVVSNCNGKERKQRGRTAFSGNMAKLLTLTYNLRHEYYYINLIRED
jgi:hypothetical protein